MLEAIGYIASVLTAVSLMMNNIWRLRWLNMLGSAMLLLYGVLVDAWPVAVVNAFIVLVDAYYIWELHSKKDLFSLTEVSAEDSTFLTTFLDLHGRDIKKFFPEFALPSLAAPHCIFILRNLTPVGLFIYEDEGNKTARIHLDYVAPPYRDLANAHFFYNQSYRTFVDAGFREFVIRNPTPIHERYSRRLGFAPSSVNPSALVKTLVSGKDIEAGSR